MVTANVAETAEASPAWFPYKESETWSGLSRATLWSLAISGEIKAVFGGRAVRLIRRSVEDFIQSRTKKDVVNGE